MRTTIAKLSMFLALSAPAMALAHGGHAHLMGTVAAIDASHVDVKEKNGKVVSVTLDDGTKFVLGKTAGKASDATVGKRVVVHTAGDASHPRAAEVQMAAVKRNKG